MSTVPTDVKPRVGAKPETLADLLDALGDIPPYRVRFHPLPGMATQKDVLAARMSPKRQLYELVDGVLVEKAMGYKESILALFLGWKLAEFVDARDLGVVAGEAGLVRLVAGLVRIPDVSFVSWDRLAGQKIPDDPIPDLAPDLAVEVLSPGNTPKEMQRKIQEYFAAGVRLVWIVDPVKRTVAVYTAPDQLTVLTEDQTLDGGAVLPGFTLPLRQLFARAGRRRSVGRRANQSKAGKRRRPKRKS
jgi:Uma2 family endonuclease